MTKAQLQKELDTLRADYADLKQDRDGLLIRNHEVERKFEHEVGRLNTIIGNYRQEIIQLGLKK